MFIKIKYNHIYLQMYSNIKWQSSTMQNQNYICTNLLEGETVTDFIFLGSKIIEDGDCSHELKRDLLFGRKAMTNLTAY